MPRYNYKLCMGCMEHKEDEDAVCELCGYDPNTPHIPEYLAPGTFINDRYVVGKLLRYNGEGADYIGFDTVTSSKVTIREYMPDTLCSRNKDSSIISVKQECVAQYKAFMSEFVELNKTLAKMRTLNHINPAIDMFGDNNTGYVVFRYIEGMNLGKYLKQKEDVFSWEEVKRMFPPIFTTLSLVHNAGLIHRGISLDNIIVTDKQELKFIGFCIADARTANTELASEIYSGYAAPEQYSSSDRHGTWTDVYGICALLYRLLTGVVPEEAIVRTASDTLAEPKDINDDIPAHVSRMIMNGMALSGDDRIQTVTELVTGLFDEGDANKPKSVAATQTISIPKQYSTKGPAPVQEHTPKPKPKRTPYKAVGVTIAIVLLAVAILVLMMGLEDNSSAVVNGIPSVTTAAEDTTGSMSDVASSGSADNGEGAVTEAPASMSAATGISTLPTLAVLETASDTDVSQTSFKPGATIYIMNELVGKSFDTVKNTSINDSLTITPEYIYTDEYEKGMIFEQSIEKGSNYEKGAELTLKVSMGPAKVLVPEFYGLNKKDYFDILNNAGIKYEEKPYEYDKVLHDYVAWISIDPGEYIDLEAGEVLSVFVAVNPDNTEPSETTTVTSETTEASSAWVTTIPPVVTEVTESNTAITLEPDIIITVDY